MINLRLFSSLRAFARGNGARNVASCALVGLLVTAWQIGLAVLICEEAGIVNRWEFGLFQWDSRWFYRVADLGYVLPENFTYDTPGNFSFLPAYPLLSRFLARLTGLDLRVSMLVAAELCCWGFWIYFLLFLREAGASREVTIFAVGLIVLHPVSFYLVAAYSESLFLLCLFGLLYWLERPGRVGLLLACLHGYVLTATRLVGVSLIFYPLIRTALARGSGVRLSWGRALTVTLAAASGIGSYLLYCQLQFGDWRLFIRSSQAGWGIDPYPLAIFDWRVYFDSLTFWNEYPLDPNVLSAACAVYGLLAMGGLACAECVSWRRGGSHGLHRRLGIYCCALFLFMIPFSTHARIQLKGFSRFSLPVMALLALAGSLLVVSRQTVRPRRWLPWLLGTLMALGAVANGLMTMRFTAYEWVASANRADDGEPLGPRTGALPKELLVVSSRGVQRPR